MTPCWTPEPIIARVDANGTARYRAARPKRPPSSLL